MSLVATALKARLEDFLAHPENITLPLIKQSLQSTLTSLTELSEKDENLLPVMHQALDEFLKHEGDIELFTATEFSRFLNEDSYCLPIKPRTEPTCTHYEIFLQKMARLCIEHPEGEFKKLATGTSSGVYRISLKGKPLFIFKPCDEEPHKKVYPKGEGALREFYCFRMRMKCALAEIADRKGFLSEFYPHIIGSIQYFQQLLPDQIAACTDTEEKAALVRHAAMGELIGLKKATFASELKIWDQGCLGRAKLQRMMLEALWDVDYDLNQGNFLVQAKERDGLYQLLDLINIDRGHALPSRPLMENETVRIWRPGWIDCEAANDPIDPRVENEFKARDPYQEAIELKDKIPSMSEEGRILIVLTRWYIQIGLEHHFTIAQLLPHYLDNKIFEMMPNLKLKANGASRANIKFRNKCLQYLRTLVLPPAVVAKLAAHG